MMGLVEKFVRKSGDVTVTSSNRFLDRPSKQTTIKSLLHIFAAIARGSMVEIADASSACKFTALGEILLAISSDETIEKFLLFCQSDSNTGAVLRDYSWEIYDGLFCRLLSDTGTLIDTVFKLLTVLAKTVRPREMYIMSAEKLSACTSVKTFSYVLFSIQLAMSVGSAADDMFNTGTRFSHFGAPL